MTEIPDYISKKVWKKEYPKNIPHEINIPNVSLVDIINEKLEKYSDRTAYLYRNKKFSFQKLDDSASSLSTALRELGIGKNNIVSLYMSNSPDWIISYYGVLRSGATVTGISPLFVPREIKYQLSDSKAETIILHEKYYQNLLEIIDDTNVENIIITSDKQEKPSIEKKDKVYHLQNLIDKHNPISPPDITPEDIAVLQYTGGTTGRPKGCKLTHKNLVANVSQNMVWYNQVCEKEGLEYLTALSMLPWYHIYGQTLEVNTATMAGAEGIIAPEFDPEKAMELIEEHECQLFLGVPTMFLMLANHPKFKDYDLSSLIWVISGAGPLPRDVVRKFEKFHDVNIKNGYGLSEASPVTHVTPPFAKNKRKFGVLSVGIGYPNTYYGVIDPEKEAPEFLKLEEVGELVVSGPQVMEEYWERPEKTEEAFFEAGNRRWLKTGDISFIDEKGYTYPIDRKKQLIKYKGHSVFPREIEETYFEHPAVNDIAVIGVPDPEIGSENIKAFITLNEDYDEKISEDELINWGKEKLAEHKYPREIEFIDNIPKTDSGKYLKRKLKDKEMFGEDLELTAY